MIFARNFGRADAMIKKRTISFLVRDFVTFHAQLHLSRVISRTVAFANHAKRAARDIPVMHIPVYIRPVRAKICPKCPKFRPGRGSKKLGHLINLRNLSPRFRRCPSFLSYHHSQLETSHVWEISETSDKVISIIPDFQGVRRL